MFPRTAWIMLEMGFPQEVDVPDRFTMLGTRMSIMGIPLPDIIS